MKQVNSPQGTPPVIPPGELSLEIPPVIPPGDLPRVRLSVVRVLLG